MYNPLPCHLPCHLYIHIHHVFFEQFNIQSLNESMNERTNEHLSNSDILELFMNVDDDDFTYVIYNIFIHKQQIAFIFNKKRSCIFFKLN